MKLDNNMLPVASDDDSGEFMETAVASDMDDRPKTLNELTKSSSGRKNKEERVLGGLSQYATTGDVYIPTTSTVRTLPPDCYTMSLSMDGQFKFQAQKLVTDDLLRLPDSKSDAVIAEVEHFWTLKDKFKKYGFAHKRGFMLFGPPGSGKTSTIAIIINDMIKRGGIVLLGENPAIMAMGLKSLRAIEPERPLVVILEDIDTIIFNYGESMVLSILDGEAQVENVVFIATTNYPEKLDGRIINRPSRFDKIVKIGMPNAQARELFLKSKLDSLEKDGVDLVKETEGFSIAHLKEMIISTYCQESPIREVLDRLKGMKKTPKSSEDNTPVGFGMGIK